MMTPERWERARTALGEARYRRMKLTLGIALAVVVVSLPIWQMNSGPIKIVAAIAGAVALMLCFYELAVASRASR